MKTIHKFRIEPGKEATALKLKEGFRIVRCEYIVPHKAVYLWVEQPLHVGIPNVEKHFRIAFSGEPVPDEYRYLGTALDPFGPEAFHLFEVPSGGAERETAAPSRSAAPALLNSVTYRHVGTA